MTPVAAALLEVRELVDDGASITTAARIVFLGCDEAGAALRRAYRTPASVARAARALTIPDASHAQTGAVEAEQPAVKAATGDAAAADLAACAGGRIGAGAAATKAAAPSIAKVSDTFLVRRAQSGDERARHELVERYVPFGLHVCRHVYAIPGGDRDDVRAEVMVGIAKAIGDYRSDRGASFRSFVSLCVQRQVITALKTATRESRYSEQRPLSLDGPVGTDDEGPTFEPAASRVHQPDVQVLARDSWRRVSHSIALELTALEQSSVVGVAAGASHAELYSWHGYDCAAGVKAIDNANQRGRKKLARLYSDEELAA